jgi:hypothetical protein
MRLLPDAAAAATTAASAAAAAATSKAASKAANATAATVASATAAPDFVSIYDFFARLFNPHSGSSVEGAIAAVQSSMLDTAIIKLLAQHLDVNLCNMTFKQQLLELTNRLNASSCPTSQAPPQAEDRCRAGVGQPTGR